MGVFLFLFLFLPFLFLLLPHARATNGCATSACSNSSFVVRFPFRIRGQQPQHCAFPGFDLSCNDQGLTILNLPYSGEFIVRYIDYPTQEILLDDPSNCLARRLLGFNLSGTPFAAAYYLNYTFLSCPSELTRSRFTVVDCLSNSTNTTLATTSTNLAAAMTMCRRLATLPIPVSWPLPDGDDGFSSDLNGDIQIKWSEPDCEVCEAQSGMCGFENNTSQKLMCFQNLGTGKADNLRVLRIVSFSIVVPAITCAFCIVFIVCFINGRQGHRGRNATQQNLDLAAQTVQPSTAMAGLDESTIESYNKVVLGESLRLPQPNGSTCPICLSEYSAKETVRCIPDCKHCFHVHCIDEWLRMNSTCPVCRNSPSPAPAIVNNFLHV